MLKSDSLSPAHFNVVFGIGLLENMCVQYGCHSRNPGRPPGRAIKTKQEGSRRHVFEDQVIGDSQLLVLQALNGSGFTVSFPLIKPRLSGAWQGRGKDREVGGTVPGLASPVFGSSDVDKVGSGERSSR